MNEKKLNWILLIGSICFLAASFGYEKYDCEEIRNLIVWALICFGTWFFWMTWPKVETWKHSLLLNSTS